MQKPNKLKKLLKTHLFGGVFFCSFPQIITFLQRNLRKTGVYYVRKVKKPLISSLVSLRKDLHKSQKRVSPPRYTLLYFSFHRVHAAAFLIFIAYMPTSFKRTTSLLRAQFPHRLYPVFVQFSSRPTPKRPYRVCKYSLQANAPLPSSI